MFSGRLVKRAWGWYFTIIDRRHFKIKLLRFYQGKYCSHQYHNSRHELWLFLTGNGKFTCETAHDDVMAGDYRYVWRGFKHKYLALSKTLVLEIQYGEKCSEEDIVRV